jgi:hypothetical protein
MKDRKDRRVKKERNTDERTGKEEENKGRMKENAKERMEERKKRGRTQGKKQKRGVEEITGKRRKE